MFCVLFFPNSSRAVHFRNENGPRAQHRTSAPPVRPLQETNEIRVMAESNLSYQRSENLNMNLEVAQNYSAAVTQLETSLTHWKWNAIYQRSENVEKHKLKKQPT